jgi:hypothetical protein
MDIIRRDQWGARRPRDRTELSRTAVNELVVHYSSMDAERRKKHSECARVVKSIQNFHMDDPGRRYADIAYNWLFCNHGHVFEGRGWFVMSAATLHHNDHTQAICFLGGDAVKRDDVTPKGRLAGVWLARQFFSEFGKRGKQVVGHRDRGDTECPGDELYAWIKTDPWDIPEDDPDLEKPWPLPIPRWFWPWAKWVRGRWKYPTQRAWRAARPKSAPQRVPDWAWVRLAAMTPT